MEIRACGRCTAVNVERLTGSACGTEHILAFFGIDKPSLVQTVVTLVSRYVSSVFRSVTAYVDCNTVVRTNDLVTAVGLTCKTPYSVRIGAVRTYLQVVVRRGKCGICTVCKTYRTTEVVADAYRLYIIEIEGDGTDVKLLREEITCRVIKLNVSAG